MSDLPRDEHGRRTYHDIAVPVVAAHLRLEDELREENERLRAIVADLVDCDPREPVWAACTLCRAAGQAGHTRRCPWKRALDFMGGAK